MHPALVQIEKMSILLTNALAELRSWEPGQPIQLIKDQDNLKHFTEALPGKRVLDVGCGHGWYSIDLQAASLDYLGIDNSPEMIRLARAEFPQAKFQIMSLNRLEFAEDSFDGIWACCAFGSTPKPLIKASLEKMRSMLTRRGVIMATAIDMNHSFEGIHEFDPIPYWRNEYTPEEFRELFRHTGFRVIGFWQNRRTRTMSVLAEK